jgi:hypothetical protein
MAKSKPWSNGEREAFWRQQIVEWKQSGQTIRAFCGERKLTESQFHLWRRNLGPDQARIAAAKSRVNTCAFVPVSVAGPVASPITVELYDARLSIEAGADAELLRIVLQSLRGG